ncbi:hypothetical protein [Blautia ammoniilytica]|uniref:Uncharacterized protein n=1 Tax=Blautia ammoniilytica TaxID=2981782 RepID=A0ABT2TVW9_9FIRM|nr:hypothetical protein [Blautia ammoniilytica]MCU6766387.1 hypothetical protein [Blautia ammoniilytica]SCI57117.1 Uncharacterised protein [uncultured Blautia sp.]
MSNKYSHWGKLAPAAVVLAAMLASGKGGEALSGQEIAQTQIVKASGCSVCVGICRSASAGTGSGRNCSE